MRPNRGRRADATVGIPTDRMGTPTGGTAPRRDCGYSAAQQFLPQPDVNVKLPLQVIVRVAPSHFRIATVCPAPLWDTLRVIAYDSFDWPSAAAARAWADGRLLEGVWMLGDDGFARRPLAELDPRFGLVRAWVRPCACRNPNPLQPGHPAHGACGSA